MIVSFVSALFFSCLGCLATAAPANGTCSRTSRPTDPPPTPAGCFPALGFQMPRMLPSSLDDWWCDPETEYAFMGFSYEISECQSPKQLDKEFKDIRQTFRGRYVRLYGACDEHGYYDTIVDAAWNNGLGVHALVWFGFDGTDIWKTRWSALLSSLRSNPKAKFVTRVVQFGSEPLYDQAIATKELADQVTIAKQKLSSLEIPVTVSELTSAYKQDADSHFVLEAIDSINIHMLPFFSPSASTGKQAWPLVKADLDYFSKYFKNGTEKKMYLDENGWPSVTSSSVQPNNKVAKASIQNEQDYFTLLDEHCEDLKGMPVGGVGWFAHIYSDEQEPGYGIYDSNGKKKWAFAPRTQC